MVYESGFTTRRTYSSRPIVTSYTVTYPTVQRVSRVYKTSFPIYSSYSIPRRIITGSRVITSPVRVVTSPARIVTRVYRSPTPVRFSRSPSPVRITRTTTRIITTPERTSSYTYTTPTTYTSSYLPSTYLSPYTSYPYLYSTPSYLYSPVSRLYTRSLTPVRVTTTPVHFTPSYLKRISPGYGARALTNYLNTEPFDNFREETNRIRYRAQSLMRDIHTPVVHRARSSTPFPVMRYPYGPTSQLALDSYVARVTNPNRHLVDAVREMSLEPTSKYIGKSHLASVRICGEKAYNIRKPMYDSDRVKTNINLLSWYLRHPEGKIERKIERKIEKEGTDTAKHSPDSLSQSRPVLKLKVTTYALPHTKRPTSGRMQV